MDILLISRCPPFPLHLGDRLIPYHLAQELSARQYRIDLLAFYDDPRDPEQTSHYERFFGSIQLIREPRRSTVDYARRLPQIFPHTGGWSPPMWSAIRRRLASSHYDLVQLFGGIHVYEYRDLVKHLPNVIVPYESYSLFLRRRLEQERRWRGRVGLQAQLVVARYYEKRMFDGYDRVVVLTEPDERALHGLAPRLPIRVIPNGVDIDFFTPAAHDADEPILLFTGNYDYAPNIDAALQLAQHIFPTVKKRIPQAKLLLVGNNPPPAIRSLARQDIEVTGRVPDVRPYLQRAAVFVCPLRFGAGIKNKVLEAMAMQKPVIATPVSYDGIVGMGGEQPALIGHTTEELADAVLRVLEDRGLRRQIGQAGRKLVESRYTWRCVADQYEELYRQVIEARRT